METLTPRELQIAEAVARGLRNRQIASEFGISPETVKRHLATIYDKLAIRSRVLLALRMLQARHAVEQPLARGVMAGTLGRTAGAPTPATLGIRVS